MKQIKIPLGWVVALALLLMAFAGNGPFSIQGLVGVGGTGTANPLENGCLAVNQEQTNVANGKMQATPCDLSGKPIFMPFANKENMLRGTASQSSTTATTIIGAQGVGIKIYVTAIQCGNSGSTTDFITLNDTASTPLINPSGAGTDVVFPTPLVVAANTALQFTPGAASTTQTCNAQGYQGS